MTTEGTASGFEAAYREHRLALLRLAYLLSGSHDLSEDVVHAAFTAPSLREALARTRPISTTPSSCGCVPPCTPSPRPSSPTARAQRPDEARDAGCASRSASVPSRFPCPSRRPRAWSSSRSARTSSAASGTPRITSGDYSKELEVYEVDGAGYALFEIPEEPSAGG